MFLVLITYEKKLPLKFFITNFFEAPVLPDARAGVLAMPLVLSSVKAEKLALLFCRVSSAIIWLALWLNAVWFKCFAKLLLDWPVTHYQQYWLFVEPALFG